MLNQSIVSSIAESASVNNDSCQNCDNHLKKIEKQQKQIDQVTAQNMELNLKIELLNKWR